MEVLNTPLQLMQHVRTVVMHQIKNTFIWIYFKVFTSNMLVKSLQVWNDTKFSFCVILPKYVEDVFNIRMLPMFIDSFVWKFLHFIWNGISSRQEGCFHGGVFWICTESISWFFENFYFFICYGGMGGGRWWCDNVKTGPKCKKLVPPVITS